MALNRNGRSLPTMIAAALMLGFAPLLAWGQAQEPTWDKLIGKWCDAERGCTHWWTTYDVQVRRPDPRAPDKNDSIAIYVGRFLIFNGKIKEPIGPWVIKGHQVIDGKKKEKAFDAVVSELQGLKEVIEGKIKGSLRARIQSVEIAGFRVQEVQGITISEASIDDSKIANLKVPDPKVQIDPKIDRRIKIDNPKIDDLTIDNLEIEGRKPPPAGSTIETAKSIMAEKLSAKKMATEKIEAKEMIASKLEAKKIQGKKIEGDRQVEISVPIQISEATIEGSTKAKGKSSDDDDDDGKKKKLELKGTIKGKVTLPSGEISDWKGDFEGTFTALVQASIKGIYVGIPAACSEAGSPLSGEQKQDLKDREDASEKAKLREKAKLEVRQPGRYRSSAEKGEQKERLDIQKLIKEEITQKVAEEVKKGIVVEAKKEQQIKELTAARSHEAFAGTTRSPRPAEPHTSGKFMRKVSGTVSAIEPYTITLELPALPVLDHRCSVRDEVPKRTLKLVKQHDGVR